MPRLTVTDFNTPRYFGYDGNMPGGYGLYQPIITIVNPAFYSGLDINDEWGIRAQRFVVRGGLSGRRILELGCGYGSLVRKLRGLGADAYGLDLSWPINQGINLWPEMLPYLIAADARDYLADPNRKRNEWDAVISRKFLDCLSDSDLAAMIPQMNYITKFLQVHFVDDDIDGEYYNRKTLAEWQALPFEAGTIVLDGF